MSPLPGWLGGAHHVALNMSSDIDLAVRVHFALFEGSRGYVLKPHEMRGLLHQKDTDTVDRAGELQNTDNFWPPARETLHRTTILIVSLHKPELSGAQSDTSWRPSSTRTRTNVACGSAAAQ